MPPHADRAPRRFRFVVFDWDGTLADSTATIASSLQRALDDIGEPVPDEVDARFVIGLGIDDALRHVAPDLARDRYPALAARYGHHYLARDLDIPLFPGVREMLAELGEAGFLLGIATGKSRAGLERVLAQYGIGSLFTATRCADEDPPKPSPGMLLHLMQRVGVDPEETLMVGDTTHDMELARNAGTAALAVAYGAHASSGLQQASPLAVVHTVAELRAWLRAHA